MRNNVAALAALAACSAGSPIPPARFANAPAAWVVADREGVAKRPHEEVDYQNLEAFDESVVRPVTRAFELPRHRRALGTNALDEVPDSTWFENRIGVRALTPHDVYVGPQTIDSPELHLPWTVKSTKPGGGPQNGLIVLDARGIKYLIKFDGPHEPERESGTHVVVNRLLWACGYRVPEDVIVYIRPSDLVLAKDAARKNRQGNRSGALDRAALDAGLAKVWHEPDGRIRALASRWLPGEPLGGPLPVGTRAGDPNDRIPHELRRDLRGRFPIFAWVDHDESTRSNMLDMWTPDPRDERRRYVVHYLIDFGRSMAVRAVENRDLREGHEYYFDYGAIGRSIALFGFDDHPWGHAYAPELRGVSPAFVADDFDPGGWRPVEPYVPFDTADRYDMLWGAKLIARFTRAHVEAAVEAGRFTDPRAARYLVDTLVARQRATLAYWFARVAAIDGFVTRDLGGATGLCFADLALAHRVFDAASTRYVVRGFDASGRALRPAIELAGAADVCTPALPLADGDRDAYTIIEVAVERPRGGGRIYVHIAREPRTGTPRVIGIWRD